MKKRHFTTASLEEGRVRAEGGQFFYHLFVFLITLRLVDYAPAKGHTTGLVIMRLTFSVIGIREISSNLEGINYFFVAGKHLELTS